MVNTSSEEEHGVEEFAERDVTVAVSVDDLKHLRHEQRLRTQSECFGELRLQKERHSNKISHPTSNELIKCPLKFVTGALSSR